MGALTKTFSILLLLGVLLLAPVCDAGPTIRHQSANGKFLVVGDIHGDFNALFHLLLSRGLIDKKGRWIAEDVILVVDGDFVGKGKQSFETAYFLMKLRRKAKEHGGRLLVTPGNHELRILQGDTSSLSERDKSKFARFFKGGAQEAFSTGALGDWFESVPAARVVDRSLVMHADPDERLGKVGLRQANEWFSQWVSYYQGKRKKKPHKESRWVIEPGNRGGLVSGRTIVMKRLGPKQLDTLMERLKVDRVITAHTPTSSRRVEQMHGGRVLRVDTGISKAVSGRLSIVEVAPVPKKEIRNRQKKKKGNKDQRKLGGAVNAFYPKRGGCKYDKLAPQKPEA